MIGRAWLTTSSTALRVDRWLSLAAGVAAALAAVVAATTLVTHTPLFGIEILLIPGIPLLILGQLWTILVLNARLPKPTGGWLGKWKAQMQAQSQREFFFGGLPPWAGYALMAAILLGWLAAVTSFPALSLGNPADGYPGCPWPLVNHGFATCVSHARYEEAAGAGERAVAGVLMFFFVVHAGVARSELARRRP